MSCSGTLPPPQGPAEVGECVCLWGGGGVLDFGSPLLFSGSVAHCVGWQPARRGRLPASASLTPPRPKTKLGHCQTLHALSFSLSPSLPSFLLLSLSIYCCSLSSPSLVSLYMSPLSQLPIFSFFQSVSLSPTATHIVQTLNLLTCPAT